MTSKLRIKAIYRHICIYIGKAWEWRLKAYSTLVLDRSTVLFSVHGTVVSLRITVLSLNLSRLGQRTQFLLDPASRKLEKPTTDHHGEIFLKICHHPNKSAFCTSFQACALNTPNRRGGQSSKLNTQTIAGKLTAMTRDHLVICILSFQYSNLTHTHTNVF